MRISDWSSDVCSSDLGQGALLPDAQRITAVGRFLRRSRLDALPELINIARGEMDFVGPRPLLPHSIAAMGRDGVERGKVRPGLTGLAQVSGNTDRKSTRLNSSH